MDATVKTCGNTKTDMTAPEPRPAGLQPFLHDSCVTLSAPSLTVSRPDGHVLSGADGFFHGDRRALARLTVLADGIPVTGVDGGMVGADRAVFRAVLRGLGEVTPDPAVTLTRRRRTASGHLEETLEVINAGTLTVRFRLVISAATDLAAMEDVKTGAATQMLAAVADGVDGLGLRWEDGAMTVRLDSTTVPDETAPETGTLTYDIELAPGAQWRTVLTCSAHDRAGDLFPAPAAGTVPWSPPRLHSADHRLDQWLRQSTADLERLLLTDPDAPGDRFLAAGAPWFLTLFGRDSLWAARMLLPLGTDLAAGTLRTLARRQGRSVDPATQEQPGKILHEVRRDGIRLGDEVSIPPLYYGTVDATPLWVILLHDAWRWGLAPDQVEKLLPALEAALAWMDSYGDADGDGFLEYIDTTGRGLANQGWKDSGDSIRYRDGRLATAPIALCEVQAYAYEAARGGAALLRAFGRPGADRWEEWADRLANRFRKRFWVEDEQGPYPAMALDCDKRPVDAVTSGFGHLLGTGLLNQEESALLAARLIRPDLDSGFGLRTLSAESAGYNPLGYHIGSVWPHDTAIAVHGLVRAGFPGAAAPLVAGLTAASAAFDARLPELFAGHGATDGPRPAPYPAACRPQAWSAAASVLVLQSILGLSADVPDGVLTVAPLISQEYRPMTVSGLQAGGRPIEITVAADGTPDVKCAADLQLRLR